MEFERDGTVYFTAPIDSTNTAYLAGDVVPVAESAQVSSASTLPLDATLWHRRFAHFHHAGIQNILSGSLVTGMRLDTKTLPDPICEPCLSGKLTAAPFPTSTSRSAYPLQLVHTDVHGPMVRTPSGMRNWVTFVDDATRLYSAEPMRTKDMTFPVFKRYKAWAENRTGRRIGILRDDKGGEYMSTAFGDFCDEHGIGRQHTIHNRPQQNGVAERVNRTLREGITTMLHEAKLPDTFWGEALCTVVYTLNRTPRSANPGITPYEAFFGIKPDVSNLRIFGSLAYVHVQKDKRGQFGSHMEKCIFLGYPDGYKGWRFYNPSTKRIVISERAIFDERCQPGLKDWNSTLLNHPHPPDVPPDAPPSSVEHPAPPSIPIPPLEVADAPASHAGGERDAPAHPNAPPANAHPEQAGAPENQQPPGPRVDAPVAPQAPAPPVPPPPVRTPSPEPSADEDSPPPRPPSGRSRHRKAAAPNPEPVRRSTRPHNPPGEWWKAGYKRAQSTP